MRSNLVETTDTVVVGSGAAGLTFALEATRTIHPEHRIVLITKGSVFESNTRYAQGGIAAAFALEDDYQRHIDDTMRAGDGLCDPRAVQVLVREAPARIRDLMRRGVDFDRDEADRVHFTREGGHSDHRVLHVGDMTGKAIEDALVAALLGEPTVDVRPHSFALALFVEGGRCRGVWVLDPESRPRLILAPVVVLATGGAGCLYARTTNPVVATGDGFAMALRAGATTSNMEFVQFHPTAFEKEGAPPFLLSEALRGEGGRLYTLAGDRLMEGRHPMVDLAPRDIVARAIFAELERTGAGHVWLDMTHLDSDFVKRRFPTLYARCLAWGVDMASEPVPVAPAAHYSCGGIATDIDGRSSIPGLYAVGEVACTGVHGANRLASNSLLESIVFAYRAAVHADWYQHFQRRRGPAGDGELDVETLAPPGGDEPPPADLDQRLEVLRERVQGVMWERVGVVRSDAGLGEASAVLGELSREVEGLCRRLRPSRSLWEVRNVIDVARAVVDEARRRRHNAGGHFNRDLADAL